MTKMTYVQAIDSALMVLDAYFGIDVTMTEPIDRDEVHDKLVALRAQLEKRHSKSRKPTTKQKENETIKAQILEILADGRMTCGDIAKALDITGQRCSALLRQLGEDGTKEVVKTMEKKVAYFSLAA